MSRDQILAAIQISLNANRPQLLAEAARVTHEPPPFVLPAQDDLAGQFVAEVQKLEGKAYRVATAEEALAIIEQLIIETQARQVIGWDVDQIELPGLAALLAAHGVTPAIADIRGEARQARLQELEPIPICLSGVELAIAESGTLLLRHGPGRPRLASLLSPCHIAIVFERQLVRGLGEALTILLKRYGEEIFGPTSNLTFITGPSRTADIEMTLSLGIHGPPQLHVILVAEG
ncbi:lactate utilization protein [Chloroflexus sp. MS-CIW-1]|jgi:L-lactate dehydrogenase complex protein LldG|uniref:LutC/YkgG family protein n=1 Tax=unclassified Chloroflexus TaxID=2633855 RepID=UPI0004DF5E43|nr:MULTISPECIES: lactate utilization protein [unclassified Chloroflexus]MBO9348102.1 lactate utilization protein [Chloroflexus sp.]MDN5270456.1 lactate utilization protein [Chloroflexus sp. MS-CIW-1]